MSIWSLITADSRGKLKDIRFLQLNPLLSKASRLVSESQIIPSNEIHQFSLHSDNTQEKNSIQQDYQPRPMSSLKSSRTPAGERIQYAVHSLKPVEDRSGRWIIIQKHSWFVWNTLFSMFYAVSMSIRVYCTFHKYILYMNTTLLYIFDYAVVR